MPATRNVVISNSSLQKDTHMLEQRERSRAGATACKALGITAFPSFYSFYVAREMKRFGTLSIKSNNLNLVSLRPSQLSTAGLTLGGAGKWRGPPALAAPLRSLLPLLLRSCWGCRSQSGACLHIRHPPSQGNEE